VRKSQYFSIVRFLEAFRIWCNSG